MNRATILLAEDQEPVRSVIERVLVRSGYEVLAAADSARALALARAFPDRIDLLVADVRLPGMNGRDLAARMVSDRPEVQVLFTSAHLPSLLSERGLVEPNRHFLQKPFTPEELVGKIESILSAPGRPRG